MHYLHVVSIFVSTDLYKSAFSTYSFGKLDFSLFVLWLFVFLVSVSLVFSFYFFVLCFEFNVIHNNVRVNNILQFSSHFIQIIG